jgi:hypothetical protein
MSSLSLWHQQAICAAQSLDTWTLNSLSRSLSLFTTLDPLLSLYYFLSRRRTLTTSNSRTNIAKTNNDNTNTTTANMLPLLSALSLGKKAFNVYESRKNGGEGESKQKKPMSATGKLRPRIDSCEGHSAVNPFQIVRIVYWIAVVMTAIVLILGIFGVVRPTKKVAMINVLGSLPAVIFMGLASALTHGMATGAAHLINFVGNKIGITGVAGSKFITLTWTTTIMLLVNMSFWALAFFLIGRVAKKSGGEGRKRPDRTSMVAMGEYEVSRPLPVHTDRNGHAMI